MSRTRSEIIGNLAFLYLPVIIGAFSSDVSQGRWPTFVSSCFLMEKISLLSSECARLPKRVASLQHSTRSISPFPFLVRNTMCTKCKTSCRKNRILRFSIHWVEPQDFSFLYYILIWILSIMIKNKFSRVRCLKEIPNWSYSLNS